MGSENVVRFLARAAEIRKTRRESGDREELEAIARELGFTDEDLAHVAQEARAHFVRGQAFLEEGLLDDAVRELEDARILAPGAETECALAHALSRRNADRGNDATRAEALARARLADEGMAP